MSDDAQVNLLNRYPKLIGILDRLVLVGMTWVASKGYITTTDAAELANELAPLIPAVLAALVGWYQNSQVALAQKATTISPGTKVVTTAEVAAATPDNSNIVSNITQKVVSK